MMNPTMNGGYNHYVGGDFIEEGSFLILQGPSSPPRLPIAEPVSLQQDDPIAENLSVINAEADRNPLEMLARSAQQGPLESSATLATKTSTVCETYNESLPELKPPVALPRHSDITTGGTDSHLDIDMISNYSMVSSSSTETQLDDLRKQLDQVLADNSSLRDLCAAEHEKLKQVLKDYEEMKACAMLSLAENLAKCEESRRKIGNLEEENHLLKKQMEELQSKKQETGSPPQSLAAESDFEKLESMESQLSIKEDTIKQKEKQMHDITEHLNNENCHLKEIIRQNDEIIRHRDEQLRQKDEIISQQTDLLSKSNEIYARTSSEKSELESKFGTCGSTINQLEIKLISKVQEADELKHRIDGANKVIDQLRSDANKLNSSVEISQRNLEEHQQQMNVKLATLKTEHENQLDLFRMNFQKEVIEKKRYETERQALMDQLNEVNNLLSDKSDQLELLNKSGRTSSNQPSISALPGHVFGMLRKGLNSASSSNTSTENGFEIVGAGAQSPNSSLPLKPEVSPCPICNRSFDSVKRLEHHAANCGIENMADRTDPFVFP